MTDQTTDEGNAPQELDPADKTAQEPEQEAFVEDPDPMIEDAKAAQAEIDAAAAGSPQKEEGQPQEGQPEPEKGGTKDKAGTPMIPKPRFDEVRAERDFYKDQVGYMRGVMDATAGAAKPKADAAPATAPAAPTAQPPQGQGNAVDAIDAAIDVAEQKKLELARRYDEGEISTLDMKKQEIAIDKEIRDLSKQRLDKVKEESKAETAAVISAHQVRETVVEKALDLQAKHPNVAVIDALSAGVRDGVWKDITAQATRNLAARGIDVSNGDPQTKLKLIEEKARLTDDLGAFLPGYQPPARTQQPATHTPPSQKKPSAVAQARAAKLDLADQQPPSISDMGKSANQSELTEADLANMDQDQMADLLKQAPNLVKRITGQV